MTPQMQAAFIRAVYGGLLSGALVFLVGLQVDIRTVDTVQDSAIAAGVAFLSYMISRGITEGLIDSNRGPTPADVGQPKR